MQRNGKFIVGVDDDRHALVGDRVDHLFGNVVIGAFGLLLLDARLENRPGVGAGRAVHDRGFGSVDIDHRIVDAQRPERRHDMFDRADAGAAAFDGRAARGIGYVVAQRGDLGRTLEVDASESDAAVGLGRPDRHRNLNARMQPLSRKGDGRLQCLLLRIHELTLGFNGSLKRGFLDNKLSKIRQLPLSAKFFGKFPFSPRAAPATGWAGTKKSRANSGGLPKKA